MKIFGFQKTSLQDYPGKVSSIIFTKGCNFRCGYCHNPELISHYGKGYIEHEEVFAHLKKRRKMLDAGWPGLFREHILSSIPINKVTKYFDPTFGRPTKELYSMLGALILQQSFDLTDEETVQQYAYNIQWHYSLNICEETDSAKYISLKTLWNNRNIVTQNNIEDDIFKAGTEKLAEVFKVDIDKQRIDSVHIKSNMRRLGRIGIFSQGIHKFLVNLKRGHQNHFETIDES